MLKTVLDSLEGVDDAVKPFYAEADGKFALQLDGVDAHPDVANLKSAYERTKADRDTAKQERDAAKALAKEFPEDFDAEKWAKLKDGKPDDAALVKIRQEMEAELDTWKTKAKEAEQKALKSAIERDLTDALTGAGVTDPTYLEASRMMLAGQVKVGDNGAAIVETDMGPVAVSDHVKRWAADKGKAFVTPPSGGGAKGGEGTGKGAASQKRGEMNALAKANYIKEHGEEAYAKLPD